ncbi:MAG TPA: hypothetical protein VLM89_12780 [Phycisphaerae bacterium]|nr:hypothetical protein [Phycisphaerae bacterium]
MISTRLVRAARSAAAVAVGCLICTLACGLPGFLVNNTITLGGATPGGRGNLHMTVINNTPYFVSFIFGAFDPLDETRVPATMQFFADDEHPDDRIEPGMTTATFTFVCNRKVSLGDRDLINAIRDRDSEADLEALTEGVTFSDKLLSDPDAKQFTLNGVPNQTQLHGVNYQCESLVVFTFEQDASQPFGVRIDVDVILP